MQKENKINQVAIFNKVASLSLFFWVIKIISTTTGEASADFLGTNFGASAGVVAIILLAIAIVIQIKFKKYLPWMYWTVIVLVAVFGTMFADVIHIVGVPLYVTSATFFILLLVMLTIWYLSEGSLDVHSITTTKREIFYWSVIFFTFAFGTAAGDLVAGSLHLGYLDATLVFGAAIIVIPLILFLLKTNSIALFWVSYILTRPFGASGADLLGKPISHGGFGLGDGTTALITLVIIIILVGWLTITHKKEMLIEERVS
jgi:uncharacterized membrane-anchored protein